MTTDFRPVMGRHADAMLLLAALGLVVASFVQALVTIPWYVVSAGWLLWFAWFFAFANVGGIPPRY